MVSIEAIASVIQLAVAPVFLLAGIAGLLNVLTTRLARIVDRARLVEVRIPQARNDEQRQLLLEETGALWRRIRLANWSIRLCVGGALMICLVVVTLFVASLTHVNIAVLIAGFFVGAMVLVIAGLICLLREIGIATQRMEQGIELALQDAEG